MQNLANAKAVTLHQFTDYNNISKYTLQTLQLHVFDNRYSVIYFLTNLWINSIRYTYSYRTSLLHDERLFADVYWTMCSRLSSRTTITSVTGRWQYRWLPRIFSSLVYCNLFMRWSYTRFDDLHDICSNFTGFGYCYTVHYQCVGRKLYLLHHYIYVFTWIIVSDYRIDHILHN